MYNPVAASFASAPLASDGLLPSEHLQAPCEEPVVCVPAKNEAHRLPTLIAALDRQSWRGARPLRVLLLLNNSADASRLVAERATLSSPNIDLRVISVRFPTARAHAGSARRAAMEAGAEWLEEDGVSGGVLLTTDADAVPNDNWAATCCAVLEAGADVAAAAIRGDPAEEARFPAPLRKAIAQVSLAQRLALELEDSIDPTPGDPAPRHVDHTGGGLALRLETYRAVGGCPALPFREDLGLVDSVRRRGGVVRHAPAARVTVSARMHGRAPGGMAATILAWSQQVAQGKEVLVPDPAEQVRHWRLRASLRAAALREAASLPDEVADRFVAAAMAARCPDPADWSAEVPARDAILRLEQLLDDQLRPLSAA